VNDCEEVCDNDVPGVPRAWMIACPTDAKILTLTACPEGGSFQTRPVAYRWDGTYLMLDSAFMSAAQCGYDIDPSCAVCFGGAGNCNYNSGYLRAGWIEYFEDCELESSFRVGTWWLRIGKLGARLSAVYVTGPNSSNEGEFVGCVAIVLAEYELNWNDPCLDLTGYGGTMDKIYQVSLLDYWKQWTMDDNQTEDDVPDWIQVPAFPNTVTLGAL
jgi:hypothetical protein